MAIPVSRDVHRSRRFVDCGSLRVSIDCLDIVPVLSEDFDCAANPAQRLAISFLKRSNLTLICACARTPGHKKAAR